MNRQLYWHFLPANGRLQYGDRQQVEVGKKLMLTPQTQIIPCAVGYHASLHAIDALQYAPGPIACRVKLHGKIVPHGNPTDKYAARGRTVVSMFDATDALRGFARWCALQVIDSWDAPAIVREYLQTGDEKLRAAAWAAAWAAARAAAWAVARAAAWAASRDAARDAAWAAAWAAARAAQNRQLEKMLLEGRD